LLYYNYYSTKNRGIALSNYPSWLLFAAESNPFLTLTNQHLKNESLFAARQK
jgi:hypothetical protein